MAKFTRLAMALPIFNFFFQFMFANPDYDATSNLLSTMGLISALLLAIVFALPGTVSYDELVASDLRFGFPDDTSPTFNAAAAAWWRRSGMRLGARPFYPPSFAFGALSVLSAWCLTVVLLTVVVQGAKLPAETFMRLYHKWNRWVFFADVTCVVVGCGAFFGAMFYCVVVKWPDYVVYGNTTDSIKVYDQVYTFVMIIPAFVLGATILAGFAQYELYVAATDLDSAVHPVIEVAVQPGTGGQQPAAAMDGDDGEYGRTGA
ncbi:hypothetical protein TSOC_002307 [Tetrabaena socialis]|uniref:Uncharacterized protein n=1 Tax=Tetrabaena socialis TaxID=47790 RepID=A0A2J8AEH3_9CHLO|nr:hypothetical protein TSOC_002307 [Tetrabaena socialis]|eukprot:PNH10925.1 hypothetical protein TSOC_002307 [Tetrabaena socialis]